MTPDTAGLLRAALLQAAADMEIASYEAERVGQLELALSIQNRAWGARAALATTQSSPAGERGDRDEALNPLTTPGPTEVEAAIERWSKSLHEWKALCLKHEDRCLAAEAKLAEAEKARADLRAGLRPFSRHAEFMEQEFSDHTDDVIAAGFAESPITFGDFRRAWALLQATAKGEG